LAVIHGESRTGPRDVVSFRLEPRALEHLERPGESRRGRGALGTAQPERVEGATGRDDLEPVRSKVSWDMTDFDPIRRDLEAHRDEIRGRIANLAKRPELGTAQGFGKRIGDGTVEAISRLTEIGVGTSLEVGLERTERALAKLDEGTYGLCDVCRKPIAPKRLQAMPDVVLCIECAAVQPRAVAPRRR
jgi:DnaK suppressor protein